MSFGNFKRKKILAKTEGRCWFCGKPAKTIDHVKPRAKGGSDDYRNLIGACGCCNLLKDSLTIVKFRAICLPLAKRLGLTISDGRIIFWGEANNYKLS